MGLVYKRYKIEQGGFGWKQAGLLNLSQVVANIVAWLVLAPVLDIAIYKEPADKVFLQGLTAAVANIVVVAVLGTLLAWGYSAIRTKSSSLKAEK